MLIWEGNNLGYRKGLHINQSCGPLLGSGAVCCGGRLSGICLLIIELIILIFNNIQIQHKI